MHIFGGQIKVFYGSCALANECILFFFFFFLICFFNCKVLTYNTCLQTMYDTYATNRTILYLQKKTYLQCEILTLLTILYSPYNTKLAILTYNEMLLRDVQLLENMLIEDIKL